MTARRPIPFLEENNQNFSIFDSTIRDVLPKIINNLNPSSFVRLARTCKEMSKICFNNKSIQIPCWSRCFDSEVNVNSISIASWCLKVNIHEYLTDNEFMKNLSRMPFIYHVKYLRIFPELNHSLLMEIRNYFSKFPRVIIHCISEIRGVDNWDELIEFIQDFRVEGLRSLRADVPLDVLSILTQNMKDVDYNGHVPDDLVLSATAIHLLLPNAAISPNTFKELVKRFQSGLINNSIIGLELAGVNEDGEDPFVNACSEIIEVVHVDEIEESDMKPAVIYVDSTFFPERKFSLLKSDGSIGIFYIELNNVLRI